WPLKKTSVAYPVAMAASLFSVMISAYNMFRVWESGPLTYHFGGWIPPIGIEYVLDSLSAFVALVVNGVAFVVLCHAGGLKEGAIQWVFQPDLEMAYPSRRPHQRRPLPEGGVGNGDAICAG
ncbi:MAG: hypothetical protein AAB299_04170, partial [Thermodesulfobacteriota bacterium]